MKGIKDPVSLIKTFSEENAEWDKVVFDKTGYWVRLVHRGMNTWIQLISNCGYMDFDEITDYEVGKSDDENYETIQDINEFIDYLNRSKKEKDCLVDEKIGSFAKADLFWALQDCVLIPKRQVRQTRNIRPVQQEDGSYYSKKDDYYFENITIYENEIEVKYDLCDYLTNSLIISVKNRTLEECVDEITCNMEELCREIYEKETDNRQKYNLFKPDYTLFKGVPENLDHLKRRFLELGIYE